MLDHIREPKSRLWASTFLCGFYFRKDTPSFKPKTSNSSLHRYSQAPGLPCPSTQKQAQIHRPKHTNQSCRLTERHGNAISSILPASDAGAHRHTGAHAVTGQRDAPGPRARALAGASQNWVPTPSTWNLTRWNTMLVFLNDVHVDRRLSWPNPPPQFVKTRLDTQNHRCKLCCILRQQRKGFGSEGFCGWMLESVGSSKGVHALELKMLNQVTSLYLNTLQAIKAPSSSCTTTNMMSS